MDPEHARWVKSGSKLFCKGYQQTTLVSKEFMTAIQANYRELTRNSESAIYIKLQEHQIFV